MHLHTTNGHIPEPLATAQRVSEAERLEYQAQREEVRTNWWAGLLSGILWTLAAIGALALFVRP